ncbi:Ribonuclease PH [Acetobacter tropicalis]|uniref:Ribonuclease PH n=1 Tax=Acetobacter tropicalis TaxID=104102 RepID=A0A094YMS9_9PROT|nr:Ribonuclease PH [Acetobacter tropicalis]
MIGRSLRSVVDLPALGEISITLDCDVLNADGGTRCASITGAWVALRLALGKLVAAHVLRQLPLRGQVAAVSCGLTEAGPVLDLDYAEDSAAAADTNFVLTADRRIVEIQATAEDAPFMEDSFTAMFDLARQGVSVLFDAQTAAVNAAEGH